MDEELIELEETDEAVLEVEEAIGWVAGDNTLHSSLAGRDYANQHPIKAVEGLSTELESLKSLNKTIYSNKLGVANYYKRNDGPYDGYGYFVSLDTADTVKKCNGNINDTVFGVTVNDAAFVGGQFDVVVKSLDGSSTHALVRDDNAVLVATTGLVMVRCESDVVAGDFIVPNANGIARKTSSQYGYKVIAVNDINNDDIPYASIMLGVQADVTDKISAFMQNLDNRLDAAETQIITVTNQVTDIDSSKLVTSDKLVEIQETLDQLVDANDSLSSEIANASTIAATAQSAVNDAISQAISMKTEAINRAEQALEDTVALRNEFDSMDEQITDVEDRVTIVTKTISNQYEIVPSWSNADQTKTDVVYYVEDTQTYRYYLNNEWKETTDPATAGIPVALAGIQVKTDENSSNITTLTDWQGDANDAMTRIEQKADANGAYIQSTVSNINKYSVGPHSQVYGFTLEQAANILDAGMIYVPTEATVTEEYLYSSEAIAWIDDGKDTNKVYYTTEGSGESAVKKYWYAAYDIEEEEYTWTQSNDLPTLEREFLKGYLYQWDRVGGKGPYRWIAVDKDYDEVEENASGQSVYHTPASPTTVDTTYGYWYKTGDVGGGSAEDTQYEKHVLYKWTSYSTVDEDGEPTTESCWMPVATLAENSRSRAISQVRQDSNAIMADITNTYGAVAGFGATITDTAAKVNSITSWPKDGGTHYLTTISQTSSGAAAELVLSAVTTDGVEPLSGATIVLGEGDDESYIALDADRINFDTKQFTVKDTNNGNKVLLQAGNNQVKVGDFMVGADATRSYLYSGQSGYDNDGVTQQEPQPDGSFAFEKGKKYTVYAPNAEEKFTCTIKFAGKYYNTDTAPLGWVDQDHTLDIDIPCTNGADSFVFECLAVEKDMSGERYFCSYRINDTPYTQYFGFYDWPFDNGYISGATQVYYSSTRGVYLGTDGIGLGTGNFYVKSNGELIATKGQIGGWTMNSTSLTKGTIGESGSFHMYTEDLDTAYELMNDPKADWRLTIGSNFGVDQSGKLYARSGKIGPWEISTNGMRAIEGDLNTSDISIHENVIMCKTSAEDLNNYYYPGRNNVSKFAMINIHRGQIEFKRENQEVTGGADICGQIGFGDTVKCGHQSHKTATAFVIQASDGCLAGEWYADTLEVNSLSGNTIDGILDRIEILEGVIYNLEL